MTMSRSLKGLAGLAPLLLAVSFNVQAADNFKAKDYYKMASYELKSHGETLFVAEYKKKRSNEIVLRAGALMTSWKQSQFALSSVVVSALNKPPEGFSEPYDKSFTWIPLLNSKKTCTYDANNEKPTLRCVYPSLDQY